MARVARVVAAHVPGRALVLGLASRPSPGRCDLFITLPPALDAIDMVGSLALLFAAAYGLTRFAVWAKRRLAVARPPQADPLVCLCRRGAGAAGDHVLPARRA